MSTTLHDWGQPPWELDFSPREAVLPPVVDVAIVGAGFTGLAAAASLKLAAPRMSVAVLEAGRIGWGASGRTGGMALAESAAGDLPGLGDVLAGFSRMLTRLDVHCDLALPGAYEIARSGTAVNERIAWQDSGKVRVVAEVPGGTVHPGRLLSGLARAAESAGALIAERHRVAGVRWDASAELSIEVRGDAQRRSVKASKVLFASNALSLEISGLHRKAYPKLTLAAATAPITEQQLDEIGLAQGNPFYTVDLPYLWGRTLPDRSIVWGAGLVDPPASGDLEEIPIDGAEPSRMFASLEGRIRNLHSALAEARFTHLWGGPILFRDGWRPVFARHPLSENGIVLGAYAGHGVALSSYLGAWAAEALLGKRTLPEWGRLQA